MASLHLLKKTLTMLLFAPLWVGAGELHVELDAANLDLGSMNTSSSIGFSVQCFVGGNARNIQNQCGNFLLNLSSLNDYKLSHNIYPGHSINYNSTIITPGTLSSNQKAYTSQILVVPASFPVSQRAGTYTDSLTLTVSDNN
tara:strand:+ start:70 stop:495 length:426 start_codon:yes stop_codon:yes gene_type:complete